MESFNFIIALSFIVVVYSLYRKKRLLFSLWIGVLAVLMFFMSQSNDFEIIGISEDKIFLEDDNYALIEYKASNAYYEMYNYKDEFFEKGKLQSVKFLSDDQGAFNGKDNSEYIFTEILVLTILLILLYIGFYFQKDYLRIRDFISNGSKVPVTYLNLKEKYEIIGEKINCLNCNSKKVIDKEVYSNGMHMLYLKCLECRDESKLRLD